MRSDPMDTGSSVCDFCQLHRLEETPSNCEPIKEKKINQYKYIFWHMSMRVSVCLRTRGRRFDVRCVINLSSSFLFLFCFPNFCSTFISTLLGDCVGIYAFRVLSRSFWLFCSIKFVLKMWAKKSEKGKRTLN